MSDIDDAFFYNTVTNGKDIPVIPGSNDRANEDEDTTSYIYWASANLPISTKLRTCEDLQFGSCQGKDEGG